MVEVFKTNVSESSQAALLLEHIHTSFRHYAANFDLEDCDRILRVESLSAVIDPDVIVKLLKTFGYSAEVLI